MKKEVAATCISTFQRLAEYYGDPTIHDWSKNQKIALIQAVSHFQQLDYRQYQQEQQKIEQEICYENRQTST
ncbi:hypothetical protein [Oenococcus oeni]|uniref:hypothetical protein n=1 Tax=Oenococcus oeni TaxID=1247 RepID=UPI00050EB8AB|nr:hypothetical protein [Oenococcus oeni]KGI00284.1 hypothetical protein X293_08810 [Oenococcus oeni IOEB_C52]KMQ38799.1 hypothetical protein AAX19_03415 [Oenococcus oeni]